MTDIVFEARDVSRDFALPHPWLRRLVLGERPVLRAAAAVSFQVQRGSTLALVGESGAGKTTLARLAAGLDRPSAGEIRFMGQPLSAGAAPELRRRMNMVFQDPYASLDPRWRVRDIVAEPMRRFAGVPRVPIRSRVDALLQQVGLAASDGDRFPAAFSGGQRQRIAIARALSNAPEFLICDEPTSALDVSVQAQILNLISDLQQQLGLTMLLISHNLAVVRHMADQLGVMYLGRLVELGLGDTIFGQPRHPYTRLLLDAVPLLSAAGRPPRPALQHREAADATGTATGCAFAPRCRLANARCRAERPGYTAIDGVLVACHAVAEARD